MPAAEREPGRACILGRSRGSGVSRARFDSKRGVSSPSSSLSHCPIQVNLSVRPYRSLVAHERAHLSTNAAGVVTVFFDKMNLSCAGKPRDYGSGRRRIVACRIPFPRYSD